MNASQNVTAPPVSPVGDIFGDLQYTMNVSPEKFHWSDRLLASNGWCVVIGIVVYHIVIRTLPVILPGEVRSRYFEIFHNGLLAVLSLLMAIQVTRGAAQRAEEDGGWFHVMCTQRPQSTITDGPIGYWSYIFYLSKYLELVDTFILAARKKPMIFLHVYHHTIVLVLTWITFRFPQIECTWWSVLMNCGIHTVMYSYYALSVINAKPPWWGRYLTIAQMTQFVLMITYMLTHLYFHFTVGCTSNIYTVAFNMCVIASFLGLFLDFYLKKEARKKVGGIPKTGRKD